MDYTSCSFPVYSCCWHTGGKTTWPQFLKSDPPPWVQAHFFECSNRGQKTLFVYCDFTLRFTFSLISCGQMCSDILIMYKGLICYKSLLCWEHEEIISNGVHALLFFFDLHLTVSAERSNKVILSTPIRSLSSFYLDILTGEKSF